jgi:hypothetical protein
LWTVCFIDPDHSKTRTISYTFQKIGSFYTTVQAARRTKTLLACRKPYTTKVITCATWLAVGTAWTVSGGDVYGVEMAGDVVIIMKAA